MDHTGYEIKRFSKARQLVAEGLRVSEHKHVIHGFRLVFERRDQNRLVFWAGACGLWRGVQLRRETGATSR